MNPYKETKLRKPSILGKKEREKEKEKKRWSVYSGVGCAELFGRFLPGYRGRLFFGTWKKVTGGGVNPVACWKGHRSRKEIAFVLETRTQWMMERVLLCSAYPNTFQLCVINDNVISALFTSLLPSPFDNSAMFIDRLMEYYR